jgi:hypothetical protein
LHDRLHAGAIFPNNPIHTTITAARYGPQIPEPIAPNLEFRHEIASGQSFIIFMERLHTPIFSECRIGQHSALAAGSAIQLNDVKKCVNYNDVDNN